MLRQQNFIYVAMPIGGFAFNDFMSSNVGFI